MDETTTQRIRAARDAAARRAYDAARDVDGDLDYEDLDYELGRLDYAEELLERGAPGEDVLAALGER